MFRHWLIGIISVAGLLACSQDAPEISDHQEATSKEDNQNFVLNEEQIKIRESILSALEEYAEADVKSGRKGLYAQSLSMAGRADIPFFDKVLKDPRNTCKSAGEENSRDAIESLISLLGQHTVVIINEDHRMPRDRAFILELLKALKADGFTHYAAETLDHEISENGSKFSIVSDGYYSNEPIFGRLLTYAKKEDFKLVAYEQTDEQSAPEGASREQRINFRENAQRDNLISSVLQAQPDAKMIIHVGHSHVAEVPVRSFNSDASTKWMAARLKEKTGINPLTLSQTYCHSKGGSTVVASKVSDVDGNPVASYTDYAIGNVPLTFTKSRPDWRRAMGDIEVAIPFSFTTFSEPVIIEARSINLPDAAVPVDRILIKEGESDIPLLLPSGSYRVEAFNKKGRLGGIENITVPKPR